MQTVFQDLRYGTRVLRKNPTYTLLAVVTLALGIGANTAIFSVVYAMLLRPLPYPDSGQMVYVWAADSKKTDGQSSMAPLNFDDLRRTSKSFEAYSALRYASFALTGTGLPESLSGVLVTGDFDRVVQIKPTLGRWFTNEEDAPGKDRVVVISHGFWQRRLANNPNIVGQTIQINGEAHTVLGVMPETFGFPARGLEVWKPMALEAAKHNRGSSFLQTVARLKPGVNIEQARAEAASVAQQILRDNASTMRDLAFNLVPLRKQQVGDLEQPLWILFGAVFFVLLIACVNVANLVLGRATVRWKEVSVRAALGASRWRLMRLLLTESLLLSSLGGVSGLLVASYGIEAMFKINPNVIPDAKSIGLNLTVVVFTLALTMLTGLFFGLIPAWQISRTELSQAMRDNSRTASGAGNLKLIRNGLVIAEISLSLVLLISAGLLIKSFYKLIQVNPGFQPENLVATNINLPRARYQDEWQQADFFRRTLEAVRALPGVQNVSAATNLPFGNSRGTTSFNIDGRPTPPNTEGPQADNHEVFPHYFQTMGIPLKAGRDFTEADDRSRPGVVIINERAAQLYFPNENPIGKRLTIGTPEEEKLYGKAVSREIVGVIGNIKLLELDAPHYAEVYLPALQMPVAGMTLVVRGNIPSEQLINGLRSAVQSVDSQQPIRNPRLLSTSVENSVAAQRFIATLLLLFAGIAFVLALVGIYGVMSYTVTQRTQEIGIRVALGAQSSSVLRLILGQGLKLIGIGLGMGLLGAFYATRLLNELLYEVTTLDLTTFVIVAAVLATVAILACLIPARRATKVDPLIALRCE